MYDYNALKTYIYKIVGILYDVHNELGAGLNESIYQEGLMLELERRNIPYEREFSFHPVYKGKEMNASFRLDFLVNDDLIIELKAVSEISDDHRAQLFNYMHLIKPDAGILVNFSPKSCVIERYLYDVKNNIICTIDGYPINRKR